LDSSSRSYPSRSQPRPLHAGYNPQQRPRARRARMTYLRVTTFPGRFTEVLDPQVTATGRAVLNRLRSGGRRPGWPGSDYARYRCPPPSDRSPTQDPPARPGASQEDTAGSPGYNLWITRQIVHHQPAPLYTKITAHSTVLQKVVKPGKCFRARC